MPFSLIPLFQVYLDRWGVSWNLNLSNMSCAGSNYTLSFKTPFRYTCTFPDSMCKHGNDGCQLPKIPNKYSITTYCQWQLVYILLRSIHHYLTKDVLYLEMILHFLYQSMFNNKQWTDTAKASSATIFGSLSLLFYKNLFMWNVTIICLESV